MRWLWLAGVTHHELQLADVTVVADRIQLNIHRSKSNQVGRGMNITLDKYSVKEICPVQALEVYLRHQGDTQGYSCKLHSAAVMLFEIFFCFLQTESKTKDTVHRRHSLHLEYVYKKYIRSISELANSQFLLTK